MIPETPEEERADAEWRKALAARDRMDLRAALGDPVMRRLLYRIFEECGVLAASYTGNAETNLREGKRAIGLWLLQLVNAHEPHAFYDLLAEQSRLAARDLASREGVLRRVRGGTLDVEDDDEG